MLDPWIIEEIRRREEERRRDDHRIEITIPVPSPRQRGPEDNGLSYPAQEEVERGVTVIDI